MRRLVLACLLAACDRGGGAAPDAPSGGDDAAEADASPTDPLVVVTINLRCLIDDWDARLPVLADGLVATSADVIGVEEVCSQPGGRDALEELIAALATRGQSGLAYVRTTTHLAWDMYDEGLALLSRHPIAAVHVEPLIGGALPRKLLAARVSTPDGPRVFAVTHLDHQSSAARAQQAATVTATLDAFAQTDSTVLVGDFNESPGGGVASALASAGFADTWSTLHPSDAGFTFPASAPAARIDYVWSRGAGVRPHTIERILATPAGATYASDHLGLRAAVAP